MHQKISGFVRGLTTLPDLMNKAPRRPVSGVHFNEIMFERLLVIGTGLIGGSACAKAREKHLAARILGYSRPVESAHEAQRLGLVDECLPESPTAEQLAGVCAVLLAMPVGQYAEVLKALLPNLPHDCLIFDAGSTKGNVQHTVDKLSAEFPDTQLEKRFVGSHPIAGSERSGPAAAQADLFEGKTCFVSPGPQADSWRVAQVTKFWKAAGATVRSMPAEEHDHMFGAVSHLPHLLAFAYVGGLLGVGTGNRPYSASAALEPAVQLFSRIAASSPAMWVDIFQANKAVVLDSLNDFEHSLHALSMAIENQHKTGLALLLAKAGSYRARWKADPVGLNERAQVLGEQSRLPRLVACAYVNSLLRTRHSRNSC